MARHHHFGRRDAVRSIAWAAAAGLLAGAAGCSVEAGAATGGETVAVAGTDPGGAPVAVSPVGPFGGITTLSAAAQALLQNADNTLIAKCMRGRDFSYDPAVTPIPVDAMATTNAYALLAPATAARQGYGIVDNALTQKASGRLGGDAQPDGSAPGFSAALTGTDRHKVTITSASGLSLFFDSDGCVTTAVDELYGGQWNKVSFNLETLSDQIEQQVEASKPWTGAIARWSGCMLSRYQVKFPDPGSARTTVENSVSAAVQNVSTATAERLLQAMRPGEIKLAMQDATCQQAAGLASVAAQQQSRLQAADQRKFNQEIETYTAELEHATQTAQALQKTES